MELNKFAEEMEAAMDAPEATQEQPEPQPQEPLELVADNKPTPEDEEEAVLEEVNEEDEVSEVEDEDSDAPWMPKSLDELATALEVSPDDLKESIRLNTKVDGVEGEATLAEMLRNYQLNKSLTERSEAFAHKQKEFERLQEEFTSRAQQREMDVELSIAAIEEQIKNSIGAIDWDQLKKEDSSAYLLKRQEFMEKIGEVEAIKNDLMTRRQEEWQNQQKAMIEHQQQVLRAQKEYLENAIPEWKDREVYKQDMSHIKDYLTNKIGVSDDEIKTIADGRIVLLAKKALAYDEMQSKAAPVKAQAKTKPKFTKPSARKSKADARTAAVTKRINRLKKTGKAKDFAALLLESGND